MYRGDAKFALLNRIVDTGSGYVCRIRVNSVHHVVKKRVKTDTVRNSPGELRQWTGEINRLHQICPMHATKDKTRPINSIAALISPPTGQ